MSNKQVHFPTDSTEEHTFSYHTPVLLRESMELLITNPKGVYIDGTMGGGGHTREILRHLSSEGRLFSFDQDSDAAENAPHDDRFTFVASNFRYLPFWMDFYQVEKVDGILADLGVSSHHFDTPERGFSFRFEDAPLDMRMNRNATLSAQEILASYSREELERIFRNYGELTDAARIANCIESRRSERMITTSKDLVEAVAPLLPRQPQQRHRKLSRLFQALRIEVNDELGALRDFLSSSIEQLAVGGRLVVLTYHSLEDRIVKDLFLNESRKKQSREEELIYGSQPGRLRVLSNKGIKPSTEEIARNSRASSAKIRVAERRN